MSINEKLAELCGLDVLDITPPFTMSGLNQCYKLPDGSMLAIPSWNPIQDRNQLNLCYEVAEKAFVVEHSEVDFDTAFAFALRNLLVDKGVQSTLSIELATAWVKHPELVAQAILKAKGVS